MHLPRCEPELPTDVQRVESSKRLLNNLGTPAFTDHPVISNPSKGCVVSTVVWMAYCSYSNSSSLSKVLSTQGKAFCSSFVTSAITLHTTFPGVFRQG